MSLGLRLRALRSLITWKLPRTRPTAESSPAAVSRATAAGATAAFAAGLAGLLYFKKDTSTSTSDQSAYGREVATTTNATETRNEEAPVISEAAKDDAAVRAMFMGEDGKMRWIDYVDYLTFGKAFRSVTKQNDDDGEAEEEEQDDPEYEAAMKARFEEWMKEYGKTYKSEEESAMRYELFKQSAKKADKFYASKGIGLNHLADITEEEMQLMTPDAPDDEDWEEYVETLKAIQAHCKLTGESSVRASVIYKQLGKDCSDFDETESSIEEGIAKRVARAQEAQRRHLEEKAKEKIGK